MRGHCSRIRWIVRFLGRQAGPRNIARRGVSLLLPPSFSTRNHLAIAYQANAARADRSLDRALAAAQTAENNRGRDVVVLDLRELTCVFDYFVLVTGSSRRQLHAISEEIDETLKRQFNDRRLGIEGYADSRWILLDFGDVVVHMFDEETRRYYDLEHLWSGARVVPFGSSLPAPQNAARFSTSSDAVIAERLPSGPTAD